MIKGDGWKPVARNDDALLVAQAKEGDAGACGKLYERYHHRLFRVARTYLRDSEMATDAVHDTFVKFFVALREGRYEERGKLDSYLCLACSRVALDVVRGMPYWAEQPSGLGQRGDRLHYLADTGYGSTPDEALDHVLEGERRDTVHLLLEALPDREAEAVALSAVGATMQQAARHLVTTIPAVKARLWRARATAEVLIQHDPRFDAIRPEDMTRRRVSADALAGNYTRCLAKGEDGRAQSRHNAEGIHHQ